MTDYAEIAAQLNAIVPFAAHAGVKVTSVGPGVGRAELPEAPTTLNHIATQHAGALFTCGEAASGAALAGVFGEKLIAVRPVAKDAKIAYQKIARGLITADAQTSEPADKILATIEAEGKVVFDVNVSLKDENDVEVVSMTVAWHVKSL